MSMFSRFFRQSEIPQQYQSNFHHLYFDIAWFGVLSGTSINFLNIYAARLGASGLQIGLLGAMSGVVNLFLALPASRWLENYPYRIQLGWSLFALGALLVLGIALLTVSFQSIKAALQNPVRSLKVD